MWTNYDIYATFDLWLSGVDPGTPPRECLKGWCRILGSTLMIANLITVGLMSKSLIHPCLKFTDYTTYICYYISWLLLWNILTIWYVINRCMDWMMGCSSVHHAAHGPTKYFSRSSFHAVHNYLTPGRSMLLWSSRCSHRKKILFYLVLSYLWMIILSHDTTI